MKRIPVFFRAPSEIIQ